MCVGTDNKVYLLWIDTDNCRLALAANWWPAFNTHTTLANWNPFLNPFLNPSLVSSGSSSKLRAAARCTVPGLLHLTDCLLQSQCLQPSRNTWFQRINYTSL